MVDDPTAGPDGVCVLRLPADLGTVPDLCAHLRDLLLGTGAAVAVCDVSAFARVDLDTLEALARVQLAARELGREVWFRHASPQLRQLLALTGLSDTLPTL